MARIIYLGFMKVHVLCFGRLRDLISPELDVDVALPATVAELLAALLAQYPALGPYSGSLAVAVNQSFASKATQLKESDEVALLPPVSGGNSKDELPLVTEHARLQCTPIDAASVLATLRAAEDGAAVLFDGIVRNNTRGRKTLYLDYDSYPVMAVTQMEQLAQQAIEKFAIRDVRIVHRVGRQEIGDSSVIIVVASAHRAAAFDACRFIIDSLKKTVPIWKKEYFEDGATWVDGDPFPPEVAL